MNHKIILKCRICLEENDEELMLELFKKSGDGEAAATESALENLYRKVEYCCGVRIRESPEMPSKMCFKCFDIVRIWYNFRQLCVGTQVYLESLCTNLVKPAGEDDDEQYLEYLIEHVQKSRAFIESSDSDVLVNSPSSQCAQLDMYMDAIECNEDSPVIQSDSDSDYKEPQSIKKRKMSKKKSKTKRSPAKSKDSKEVPRKTPSRRYAAKKLFRPPSPETYMCSICGNVYYKKSSFQYHMSLHSDVKPHECELCNKTFRQVCELKNHMRRHTGEKPFKCNYCDRHFIDRSEKHRHERVHTNTRPYVCKICGKSFMYSAILKNHSKLHSGEKEFNCVICDKAFTLQHQLKAHLKTLTHQQKEMSFRTGGSDVMYECTFVNL